MSNAEPDLNLEVLRTIVVAAAPLDALEFAGDNLPDDEALRAAFEVYEAMGVHSPFAVEFAGIVIDAIVDIRRVKQAMLDSAALEAEMWLMSVTDPDKS